MITRFVPPVPNSTDIFPQLAAESLRKQRMLANPMEVVRRSPDLIIGSWCGNKLQPDRVAVRPS